ncbi:MAG TPA: methyltransferase domain-containing protein [Draconibacterium sp.]|nr:methyltransferase domain-containing protein [Draconibacterium sp.]
MINTMEVLERHLNETKTKKDYRQVLWMYDFWGCLTESKAAKIVLNLANLKDGSEILEVACGTGEMLKKILEQNPNGKNVGVDLSPDMLRKANKKLNKQSNKNFELHEGNVLQLNFSDNSFDLLINNYMVDLMPSEYFDKIANEFFRVLKPNGNVVISTFSFGTKNIHKFWYWLAKRFPKLLTGCRPVQFKQFLINAGFKIENDIEISQNTFPSQIIKAKKI